MRVLSVAYRLAPEHPFPLPLDDCWQSLLWATGHAAELGTDPRLLAVGGDSAGGTLAAAVALRARDEGGPALVAPLAAQVLIYPATDLSRTDTPSYRENALGYGLTAEAMRTFIGLYLARPGDALDPLASPLLAPDLSRLPPALVLTAEYDPLRDDGVRYAGAVEAAGVGRDPPARPRPDPHLRLAGGPLARRGAGDGRGGRVAGCTAGGGPDCHIMMLHPSTQGDSGGVWQSPCRMTWDSCRSRKMFDLLS